MQMALKYGYRISDVPVVKLVIVVAAGWRLKFNRRLVNRCGRARPMVRIMCAVNFGWQSGRLRHSCSWKSKRFCEEMGSADWPGTGGRMGGWRLNIGASLRWTGIVSAIYDFVIYKYGKFVITTMRTNIRVWTLFVISFLFHCWKFFCGRFVLGSFFWKFWFFSALQLN